MTMKPLEGIRVVDFGHLIAGPGAAAALAALGADVVKVEPPHGESGRNIGSYGEAIVATYNRGKRSIALDLRSAGGIEAARRLVSSADVVLQNMRPGAMDRLGLGAEDVRALNPRAIYASVSGFGSAGAARDRVGLDITAQAESGMMSITGPADGDPHRVGFTVVDIATADLLAQAILAALFARERTGRGEHIQISLIEVAVHLQAACWAEYSLTGVEPRRCGNPQPTVAPAADVVQVEDGKVVISAYQDGHWRLLCRAIGRPELADDPRFNDNSRRVEHRRELREVLEAALGDRTRDEVLAHLAEQGIVAGNVRDYREVPNAREVADLGVFISAASPDGVPIRLPRPPFRTEGWVHGTEPAPRCGQHTAEVLTEIGYSPDEIESMFSGTPSGRSR
ncbi:CaiB/BaiF CoA transferase family protein [Saccharopolyspora elongata]|uniref:CoA transferase n=1 Tax=Saccharopolyspora elongata TaxID=2530387 RepID=A0A4R4Z6S6_9PSEU|nr:CoA transferase [Saccharopolyspora elongata]TDD52804.1 CoA transferase [Saccharopolyspora elongata]